MPRQDTTQGHGDRRGVAATGSSELPGSPTGLSTTDSAGETFLLICPEWFAAGGISRFNRSLAIALAAAGHRTLCLVHAATSDERRDAADHRVTLVEAVNTPAGPNLHLAADEVINTEATVVIGHDRRTGVAAWTYARKHLPNARLVYIAHTAYSLNEPYKWPTEATRRIEQYEDETRQIAAAADVIAAVGPLLTRRTEAVVGDGFGGVPVVRLDPGIDLPTDLSRRRTVPPNRRVTVLTRTAHIEQKGLDVAAQALAEIPARRGELPELFIRGAPPAECDALRTTLQRCSGLSPDRIDVRPFTTDADQLNHDVTQAALCLLPSRTEGFGLAALEAIALGTPVLVSSRSGLAETLREHLGLDAQPMIIDVRGDATDVPTWRDAIADALDNLTGRFEHAHKIRENLGRTMRWDHTAATLLTALTQATS